MTRREVIGVAASTVAIGVIILSLFLAFAGCYLDSYPVITPIAQRSTYTLIGAQPDGTRVSALGFVIDRDRRSLVTSAEFCDRVLAPSIVVNGVSYVAASRTSSRHLSLCLVQSPLELGPPLVVSRTWGGSAHRLGAPGSPIWTKHGIAGVVVSLDPPLWATLTELRSFASDLQLDIQDEPHTEDLDGPEAGCPPEARARGMCVSAEDFVR